jgi:hypothetical protein
MKVNKLLIEIKSNTLNISANALNCVADLTMSFNIKSAMQFEALAEMS